MGKGHSAALGQVASSTVYSEAKAVGEHRGKAERVKRRAGDRPRQKKVAQGGVRETQSGV